MQKELKELVRKIMDEHRIMTIATVRDDGYPQATTVSFVHDGLLLYFVCGNSSQKAINIKNNPKVSVTIDTDHEDFLHIQGISLGGIASEVSNHRDIRWVYEQLQKRYPDIESMTMPEEGVSVFKIEPEVISVLDYSKGFGHTELAHVEAGDLRVRHAPVRHLWTRIAGNHARRDEVYLASSD